MTSVTDDRRCAICGGTPRRELLQIRRPDRFELHVGISQDGYLRRWVECDGCGVAVNVYAEGILERLGALSAGYYEVDFQAGTIGDKYALVMSLPAALSDNAQRVERVRRFWGRWNAKPAAPRRALDIGAGTGVFLSRFLAEANIESGHWSAVAVEPDPVAAAHLRKIGRFEVVERTFASGGEFADFDLVTLNKVVEHLGDPVALLREAATALRVGGLMYVEVPDKATLYHRAPSDNILGSLHRHLYDVCSLDMALGRAGLRVLAIERVFEPSGKISLAAFAVSPATFGERADGGST